MSLREIEPKLGKGQFQWNTGGWFGGLLGGTAFLLVGGIAFLWTRPVLATIWLSCFLLSLFAGVWIWRRRAEFAPYPAIQALLFVISILGTIAIVSALVTAPKILGAVNLTPSSAILLLVMLPAMMLRFHLVEMWSRRKMADGDGREA